MLQISGGTIRRPQKVVIYGPEGIGKTTLAAKFPRPLFIDTEGSTYHMDVYRTSKPLSWVELRSMIQQFAKDPQSFETLVIDTADWAESMCIESICSKAQKNGVEDFGYGKGYVYVMEEFGRFLNDLTGVIDAGVHVVLTAHAQMRKFEQPDEMGSYDRWEMKLSKKVAPIVKEWADMVLFANYKTYVVATDDKGQKHKAQGGKRVLYTTHHVCWDAKNRHGLPEELPLDYESIRACIEAENSAQATVRDAQTVPAAQPDAPAINVPTSVEAEPTVKEAESKAINRENPPDTVYPGVPSNLAALMQGSRVLEEEVREVLASKGHYPRGTSWEVMERDGYVEGWIIPFWDKIVEQIEADPKRLPF